MNAARVRCVCTDPRQSNQPNRSHQTGLIKPVTPNRSHQTSHTKPVTPNGYHWQGGSKAM
eukprot:363910-Chlamydomonas_euryale.AAC.15